MKLLIVTSSDYWAESLARKFTETEEDILVISTTNEDALSVFLVEEPDAVLVSEYYEDNKLTSDSKQASELFKDMKLSASVEQVVVRSGFLPLPYNDYLELPLLPEDLLELINRNRKEENEDTDH
ncbi:MAG: hypothetical protein WD552_02990 [Candidatus Paceibacterota bacterium]